MALLLAYICVCGLYLGFVVGVCKILSTLDYAPIPDAVEGVVTVEERSVAID